MASALPQEATPLVADVIHGLETATYRRDAALRQAVPYADAIAPAVIELVEKAAAGVYLLPKQENLLFWGIHVLAAGGCRALYQPLLRLLRECGENDLERLLSDATTQTLPQIVISVFDGDPGPLIEACADPGVNPYARWNLITALARLTFDGTVPREMTLAFLDRFEREPLAEPGNAAWEGWGDAVSLLGLEDMREQLRAVYRDGRSVTGEGDLDYLEKELTLARNLASGDPALFVRHGFVPLDDPVKALAWVESEEAAARKNAKKPGPTEPDPAAAIALNAIELDWFDGFLNSKHVPAGNLAMGSMEQIDGFFCALMAGPSDVSLDDYLPAIWSEKGDPDIAPEYDSEEQAEYVGNLLRRHWNTVSLRLKGGCPHSPVMMRTFDQVRGRPWAGGFLCGIVARAEAWLDRPDSEDITSFLGAITALAKDDQESPQNGMTPGERSKFLAAVPKTLVNLHCLWHGRPAPFVLTAPPARVNEPKIGGRKIGRNEPCPCGSGKKYKRCCGSPDARPLN